MSRTATEQIVGNTKLVGKTYGFDVRHDPRKPIEHWFEQSPEGTTLFLVLFSRACRWSQCLGCNLPSKATLSNVPFDDLMAQIDYTFEELLSPEQRSDIRRIILSNNGSVLDQETFSTTALMYFVAKLNLCCPNVMALVLETRPEYVDEAELDVLARALAEGPTPTVLEIAIGFEAFDERIRNDVFRKGLSLAVFEQTVAMASRHGFHIRVYLMLKPVPEMSETEALGDIIAALEYLDELARQDGSTIIVHLNPTYVAKGTPLETAFRAGSYQPPTLETVRQATMAAEGKQLTLYIGLYDEGLAVDGGSFLSPGDDALTACLEDFNRTQNFDRLRAFKPQVP
jgi:radical SAM enzyme (TIGR01210 family)